MLVIDPRIRQMPRTKKTAAAQKPVLQRLFVSAAFYKRLKNLSAVLIHTERKFGVPLHSPDEPFIRQAYGLRQSILRDGHSRQPRRKRFYGLMVQAVHSQRILAQKGPKRAAGRQRYTVYGTS